MVIVVGNAIVVCLVVVNRRRRPVQNLFIASLAVSDLFVGLLIMPLSLVNELIGYWCFGTVLCELWLAFDVLLCTASILNLCLISVDRYLCITRAMSYPCWRTKRRALWMIAAVWLVAMLVCFPPLAGWKRPQPVKHGRPLCVLSSEVGYVIYSTVASFFLPLVVMVAVYVQIYRAVRHQVRRRLSLRHLPAPAPPPPDHRRDEGRYILRPDDGDGVDDLEELELEMVAYRADGCGEEGETGEEEGEGEEREEGEDGEGEGHRHELRGHDGGGGDYKVDTDDPITNPSNTDDDGEKCTTDDAASWMLEADPLHQVPPSSPLLPPSSPLLPPPSPASHLTDGCPDSHRTPLDAGPDGSRTLILGDPAGCGKTSGGTKKESVIRLWRLGHPRQPKLNGHVFSNCFRRKQQKEPLLRVRACLKEHHALDTRKVRMARARERRLTLILGVIMAAFVFCWFPFFSTYLVSSLTGLPVPKTVFDIFFWAGYCNSALNPVIYTIFNRDIRLCKAVGP